MTHILPLRSIIFAGAMLSGLGFALGAVVPNLDLMTAFFGAVHGSGYGFLQVTCSVLLDQYFDRFRGMAYGVSNLSSPLASMIFPKLMTAIENQYGFRPAMMAVGIILMSVSPLALFLSPAPWTRGESTPTGMSEILTYTVERQGNLHM